MRKIVNGGPNFVATLKDGTQVCEADGKLFSDVPDDLAAFAVEYGVHTATLDFVAGAVSVDGSVLGEATEGPLGYYKSVVGVSGTDEAFHLALTLGRVVGESIVGVRVFPGDTHAPEFWDSWPLADADPNMNDHVYEQREGIV